MKKDELLVILSDALAKGTGTPTGISYYKTRCARKARLNREAREAGEDPGGGFAAKVGTVFHKLEELWTKELLNDIALELDDEADPKTDPIAEAQRVFNVYRKLFPPNEFEVLAAEEYFPKNDQEKFLIAQAVGAIPYTLQVDRAVRVNEQQALQAKARRNLELVPGGVYLYDSKTHDKKLSDIVLRYELEIQFPSYMMAYQAVRPDLKVLGLIVNDVVRNQKLLEVESDGRLKCFRSYLIDFPNQHQQKIVRQYLRKKHAYLQTDDVNLDACVDWGICTFYKNGLCDRLNHEEESHDQGS